MCDFTCAKYLVFFFNFLFWILGLIIMAIGAWAFADKDFVKNIGAANVNADSLSEIANVVRMFAIALLILGAIIMVIGFFGCCGAIRESQCCLGIFFVLLFICFLVTVAIGGILLFIAISDNTEVKDQMAALTDQMWEALDKDQQAAFEKQYKCCGAKSTIDALTKNDFCGGDPFEEFKSTMGIQKGCFDALVGQIKGNVVIAGCVMLGISLIEILGMSMACALCCNIKRRYHAV